MAKASKIILGKRPKNFTKTVTFDMLTGGEGCVEITYKYRTRSEFAAFYDDFQAKLKASADAEVARMKAAEEKAKEAGEPAPEFSITQENITSRQAEVHIEFIMGCVEGWNLDVSFDRDAVAELVDTLPAGAKAIISDYRVAIDEGRLGN